MNRISAMKGILLSLILIFCAQQLSFGQNRLIDSLQQELKGLEAQERAPDDTVEENCLNTLSWNMKSLPTMIMRKSLPVKRWSYPVKQVIKGEKQER